jgi:hypothetical protein
MVFVAERRHRISICRFVALAGAAARFNPKPFVWTSDPDAIIAAVRRGYQVLDSIH